MTLCQSANQSKNSATSVSIFKASEQNVKTVDNAEVLSILREEQPSPTSSMKLPPSIKSLKSYTNQQSTVKLNCLCGQESATDVLKNELVVEEIEKLLKEREYQLRDEYDRLLEKELNLANKRFDLILENEQMRTAYMLREARRERQEKIKALERQLECKNIAALMYVMCTERSRGKLEKLELIEEYTIYIQALQDLLIEGQKLILHLSRGYKTAARVDQEWREKMKKVIGEFMNFIYHFAGGPPENNQYFLDLKTLLKTEAPIENDPLEDPCEEEQLEKEEGSANFGGKNWWETLEGDNRPFIVFGDMADFKPPQRREVLKTVKAQKTAPKAWKQYNFNNLCIKSMCENSDDIKDLVYLGNVPDIRRMATLDGADSFEVLNDARAYSRLSFANRRQTALSVDIRGGSMGSLLRLITSANAQQSQPADKAALLGAVDSIEILSNTRLRQSIAGKNDRPDTVPEGVKISIGKKRISHFNDLLQEISGERSATTSSSSTHVAAEGNGDENEVQDQEILPLESCHSGLGGHVDSLDVITTHVPEKDHKINYEKVCPTDVCQRLQVDSFMRSLPSYMTANPFTHFVQTYEQYETCTKEQLEILRQRIEAREAQDTFEESDLSSEKALKEWETGIATQTSIQAFDESCTCFSPSTAPVDSNFIFDLRDLLPVKQLMDAINKACLHDERIEFNRFQVVGQEEEHNEQKVSEKEFRSARIRSITSILRRYPSLLDIFQANT